MHDFCKIIVSRGKNIPNRKASKLLFSMYSYINILSSPWMQQPSNRTRFLCWSLAISITSFLNSSRPCTDVFESLLTAISWSSPSFPYLIWNLIIIWILISDPIHCLNIAYSSTLDNCLINWSKSTLSKFIDSREVVCSSSNSSKIEYRKIEIIIPCWFMRWLFVERSECTKQTWTKMCYPIWLNYKGLDSSFNHVLFTMCYLTLSLLLPSPQETTNTSQ